MEFSDHSLDLLVKWCESMHGPEVGQAGFSHCMKEDQPSKHGPERGMRPNAVYTIPFVNWEGNVLRGEVTLPVLERWDSASVIWRLLLSQKL